MSGRRVTLGEDGLKLQSPTEATYEGQKLRIVFCFDIDDDLLIANAAPDRPVRNIYCFLRKPQLPPDVSLSANLENLRQQWRFELSADANKGLMRSFNFTIDLEPYIGSDEIISQTHAARCISTVFRDSETFEWATFITYCTLMPKQGSGRI